MQLNNYVVHFWLTADSGIKRIKLSLLAETRQHALESATKTICDFEHCPESAIKKVIVRKAA